MAHFTNITAVEMDMFLRSLGFEEITVGGVKERVYAKRVHDGKHALSLRVFTGIEGSTSRDCGKDAIRVALFVRKPDGEISMVAGDKRVHRVAGWRNNLHQRLMAWKQSLDEAGECIRCHIPLVLRKGINGNFYGCPNYPNCRFTKEAGAIRH